MDPGPHVKVKGKILNMVGVIYAISAFSTLILAFPFMIALSFICDLLGNFYLFINMKKKKMIVVIKGEKERRKPVDWLVYLWVYYLIYLYYHISMFF